MSELIHQAIRAHQAGEFAEAESLYRAIIASDPKHADAHALLGVICGLKNNHDEAIALNMRALEIDPGSALLWFHLGTVLMNAKQLSEAVTAFRQAIALQPTMAQAHYNLGNALRADGQWGDAIEAYREAILHNIHYAEAYNNLALTLAHEKRLDEALLEARKAVAIAPDYGEGWRTVCNLAESAKHYPLALEAGEQAIRLMPDSHFAWFGYGVALNRLDRNEDAVAAYKRALALKPERADIWDNLGQTYQAMNRLEEAEATFRKTVEVAGQVIEREGLREVAEEEYGNRHWHLALMELLRGKYVEGFARYRSRFKDVGGLQRPDFPKPLWTGEPLAGRTLLVSDEQGFGDTLMLCRYVPLLKKQGARIVFSVHPVLKPLFAAWPHADVIVTHGQVLPHFDFHASVFDLPYRFRTTLATIPCQVPYLPMLGPSAAVRLPEDEVPKVGVVWGGSPMHTNDARRSIPLTVFAKIFEDREIQFYSLNRDLKSGDAEALPRLPLIDLAPRLGDFADAGRILAQLDLIITCDTATAHLAGGMGKEVWTLLPFAPDWRWLTERSDSPWYPTMRLFRQPRPACWHDVMDAVQQALSAKFRGVQQPGGY
ncbi:MAG: tetratricopeptide repeat-containing glycosyltransferase family protein [Pseudomonadota bacterium]|nr:tetratricopeptide repeat-containing glycosyltransferase family protein [Pseudomonadota bacterium]